MKNPHLTTQFVVTQSEDRLEIWVDWIPAVDGDPNAPLKARMEGDVLVVEPTGAASELRAQRHVQGLQKDVLEDIQAGFVWLICGPSGILGRHHLSMA